METIRNHRSYSRIRNHVGQIGELWFKKVPEWRFGQIISNFESYLGTDIFYISDEDFIRKLNDYMNGYRDRT